MSPNDRREFGAEPFDLPESRMSADSLAHAAGISVERLESLIRLGLVEPLPGSTEFSAATAVRLRRMMRIHGDLGISLVASAMVVDLLERLDRLEVELSRIRHDVSWFR
jgi:hypothetical protein